MGTQELTILSELPNFTGNPRPGESFTNEIDARTFMRSLETYFKIKDTTDDSRKIQIMFSKIDKKRGNAIQFVNSMLGRDGVSFEKVKENFLLMYPNLKVSEIRQASKNLLDTKLKEDDIFGGMTALETATRAVAEAYLRNSDLTSNKYDDKSELWIVMPGNGEADHETGQNMHISIHDLLQNFVLHIFLSAQIHHKVYEKLSKVGPKDKGYSFMAKAVSENEKYQSLVNRNEKKQPNSDFVWKTEAVPRYQRPPMMSQYRTEKRGTDNNNTKKCFNCGSGRHTRRACPVCSYCRANTHTAKTCMKRIKESKGKFCSFCKIRDSHDTGDCRKKGQNTPNRYVRMIKGSQDVHEDPPEQKFDSNTYEESVMTSDIDDESF